MEGTPFPLLILPVRLNFYTHTGNDPRHGAPRSMNSTLFPPPSFSFLLTWTLQAQVSVSHELCWRCVKGLSKATPPSSLLLDALLRGPLDSQDQSSGKLISGSPQGAHQLWLFITFFA